MDVELYGIQGGFDSQLFGKYPDAYGVGISRNRRNYKSCIKDSKQLFYNYLHRDAECRIYGNDGRHLRRVIKWHYLYD